MDHNTRRLFTLLVGSFFVLLISVSIASFDKQAQQAQLISGIASSALYNEFLQDDNRSPNFTQVAANKVTARKYLRVKEGAQFCFGYMCFQSVCNNGSGLFYLCGATDIRHKQDQGQSGGGQGTTVTTSSALPDNIGSYVARGDTTVRKNVCERVGEQRDSCFTFAERAYLGKADFVYVLIGKIKENRQDLRTYINSRTKAVTIGGKDILLFDTDSYFWWVQQDNRYDFVIITFAGSSLIDEGRLEVMNYLLDKYPPARNQQAQQQGGSNAGAVQIKSFEVSNPQNSANREIKISWKVDAPANVTHSPQIDVSCSGDGVVFDGATGIRCNSATGYGPLTGPQSKTISLIPSSITATTQITFKFSVFTTTGVLSVSQTVTVNPPSTGGGTTPPPPTQPLSVNVINLNNPTSRTRGSEDRVVSAILSGNNNKVRSISVSFQGGAVANNRETKINPVKLMVLNPNNGALNNVDNKSCNSQKANQLCTVNFQFNNPRTVTAGQPLTYVVIIDSRDLVNEPSRPDDLTITVTINADGQNYGSAPINLTYE